MQKLRGVSLTGTNACKVEDGEKIQPINEKWQISNLIGLCKNQRDKFGGCEKIKGCYSKRVGILMKKRYSRSAK